MYICKQWAQPYSGKATYVEGVAKKFLKGELQSCVCAYVCVFVHACMCVLQGLHVAHWCMVQTHNISYLVCFVCLPVQSILH